MTIPLLPFINKLTDHLVSIRSDRWTSPHDPGPKLMAGRERVIENDSWHWEESPEGPQGAITCLIPLQTNAGTNPKTDTSRQNLIRLPFLFSPSKRCLVTWQPWSYVLKVLISLRTFTDGCKMQGGCCLPHSPEPGPAPTTVESQESSAWDLPQYCWSRGQKEYHKLPPTMSDRETREYFTSSTCKTGMARGSTNQALWGVISFRYNIG